MKRLLRIWLVAVLPAVCPLMTRAQTITFDDLNPGSLPGADTSYDGPIPNGYNGLQWNHFWVLDVPQSPFTSTGAGEGYHNGLVSGNNDAYNGSGGNASISISGGSFDLDSAYLTAAYFDGTKLEVQGYVGTTLTYDNTYTLQTESPTFVNFNYVGVDQVNFISNIGGSPIQTVMDNMTVTIVPEPAVPALASLGGLSLLFFRRQRK